MGRHQLKKLSNFFLPSGKGIVILKQLSTLELHVNKFANTVRLLGFFLLLTGGIGIISYLSAKSNFWDAYSFFLLMCIFAGLILGTVGELLWKILLVHGESTVRRFYFKDEE